MDELEEYFLVRWEDGSYIGPGEPGNDGSREQATIFGSYVEAKDAMRKCPLPFSDAAILKRFAKK